MTNQTDQTADKNPKDWVTGDEPATGPQKSYIETLAQQTGDHVEPNDLSKAEASKQIEKLQSERDESDTARGDNRDIAADTDPDLTKKDVDTAA